MRAAGCWERLDSPEPVRVKRFRQLPNGGDIADSRVVYAKSISTILLFLIASMPASAFLAISCLRFSSAVDQAAFASTMTSGFLAITASQLTGVHDPGVSAKILVASTSLRISFGAPQHAPARRGSSASYQKTRGRRDTVPIRLRTVCSSASYEATNLSPRSATLKIRATSRSSANVVSRVTPGGRLLSAQPAGARYVSTPRIFQSARDPTPAGPNAPG